MSAQIQAERFVQALYALLEETFDSVYGYYEEHSRGLEVCDARSTPGHPPSDRNRR